MYHFKKYKGFLLQIFCVSLIAVTLTGCGKQTAGVGSDDSGQEDTIEDNASIGDETSMKDNISMAGVGKEDIGEDTKKEAGEAKDKTTQTKPDEGKIILKQETLPELSEEEIAALQYIEKMAVEDYYGDKAAYDVYAPRESSNEEGYVFSYSQHGLTFYASVRSKMSADFLYEDLAYSVEFTKEDWEKEDSGYTDIKLSEVMENGDDRYQMMTAVAKDYNGSPYTVKKFFYQDMQKEDAGVLWTVEMFEINADDETGLIIDELGSCYCISMDALKPDGEWLAANDEYLVTSQNVYEPKEGDEVLEKIEGYQYMGLAALTTDDKETECPVMVPMGHRVSIQGDEFRSSMHGVTITGQMNKMDTANLMTRFYSDTTTTYNFYISKGDRFRNIWKSELIPLSDYDEAWEVVITYEEISVVSQDYEAYVEADYIIRIAEGYALSGKIKLSYEEYDAETNTLIKELETAYGMDLSKYYKESI